MDITTSEHPTIGLKNIFWNVFFESKSRGVSLARHFPWIDSGSEDSIFFEVNQSNNPIGGLVLRRRKVIIDNKEINIGIIGLVCVTLENRGLGIAAKLIDHAIAYAKQHDFDLLTLWTSQHSIYSRHHFFVTDPWHYGWVRTNQPAEMQLDTIKGVRESKHTLLKMNTTLPLPAFAIALYECIFDTGSFTVAEDEHGLIVLSYTGSPINVMPRMIQTLPAQWRLNVTKDDPLLQALRKDGVLTDLSPSNLQMWLNLKEEDLNFVINQVNIPVLDRI
ncbi:MAG: hypothetical protein NVSMB40_12470 [Aquirhabdus sp.]